jgi:hypothetical protein
VLTSKVGGANERLQELYRQHGSFMSFVKVDFQCAVSLVILASFSGVLSDISLILSILGLWVSIWWVILAWYATRHEHRFLMYVFFVFAFVEPTYIAYKFAMITMKWDIYQDLITYPCLILGGVCLLLRAVVFILGWRVFNHFGFGLASHLLNEPMAASLLSRI